MSSRMIWIDHLDQSEEYKRKRVKGLGRMSCRGFCSCLTPDTDMIARASMPWPWKLA